jgi:hypothetical protein
MAAIWGLVSSTPEKMKREPTSRATMLPTGLKAWERLRRCSALTAGPICTMKEPAAVSRNARPLAMTNRAVRKNQYLSTMAAGQKRMQPTP